ncbi:hypothetical protein Srubr_05940 [Streptomyces rubradiris]|uniref:Secreted protein n=2 Tax=Streptomyces rubradiris TaxID=285531 RepID=A0ABQ3R4G8_STRRR|nr:hypothetical protein GCM10018792_25000 [Streptomyces rubradiris]GHI50748.1 hypothetical protein Srubr_05940 [Streptomyces rubradiris]
MLAIATLAAGFVVAAVTPSHAAVDRPLDVTDTVDEVGDLVSHDSLDLGDSVLDHD